MISKNKQTFLQIVSNYTKYSALIPMAFLSFFLLGIYFFIFHYISAENEKNILNNSKESLYYAVDIESSAITKKMESIENAHNTIYTQFSHFYNHRDKYTILDEDTKYEKYKTGLIFQQKNGDTSIGWSFSFSKLHQEEIITYLRTTQWCDMSLKNAVKDNKEVVSSWVIDADGMSRYYPYIDIENFLADLPNPDNWNFYYEAKKEYNPEKKPLWSSIYLDPAGQGWMTSYIAPIYDKSDKFRGVVGLDVPIKELARNILPTNIPFNGEVFLTDNKGMLIAISDKLSVFLDLTELKNNEKGELLSSQILQPTEYNLLTHPNKSISSQFKEYFEKDIMEGEFIHKGKSFLVETKDIKGVPWKVFFLFDKSIIIKNSLKTQRESNKIVIYIFIITSILLFIFIIYLYKRAKLLSKRLSDPIIHLAHDTKDITKYKSDIKTNITEIDMLLENFSIMIDTVTLNHDNLEKQVEERTKELKLLASIDPLTKLYNRRYFTEVSGNILDLTKRNKQSLSIVMIDIDKFKNVNDTYGHNLGDNVLVLVSKKLQETSRESDIICRWGGEEFVILLPDTNIEGAVVIAEIIRIEIEKMSILIYNNKELKFTVSIGVSQVKNEKDINIETSINKADKALYEAKESGRNKVCTTL